MSGNLRNTRSIAEAILILLLSLLYVHVLCFGSSSAALAAHNHHHHHHSTRNIDTPATTKTTNGSSHSSRPILPWNILIQSSSSQDGSSHPRGSCRSKKCGVGKECTVNESTGLAECSCVTDCRTGKSNKLVCGTDGRLYSSYCELRKTACLTGAHIFFSHYQHQQHHPGDHDEDGFEHETYSQLSNGSTTFIDHKRNNIITARGSSQDSECSPLIQLHHHHHSHHHNHQYHHEPDKNPLRDKNQGFLGPPLERSTPAHQGMAHNDDIHSVEEDYEKNNSIEEALSTVSISSATTANLRVTGDDDRHWDGGAVADPEPDVLHSEMRERDDDEDESGSNHFTRGNVGFHHEKREHHHQHHRHHPHFHDFAGGNYPSDWAGKISSTTTNDQVDSRHISEHGQSPVVAPLQHYDFKEHNEDANEDETQSSSSEEFRWRKDWSEMSDQAFLDKPREVVEETLSPSAVTNLAWKSFQSEISKGATSRHGGNGHWDDPEKKGSSPGKDRPSDNYSRGKGGGLAESTVSPPVVTSEGSRHNICSPQDYETLKGELFQYDITKLMKHIKLMTSVSNEAPATDADSMTSSGRNGRHPREVEGNGNAPWSDILMASTSSPPPPWLNMEGDGPEADKDNLLRHIFTVLDRNHDSFLEYIELYDAELENRLELQRPEKTGCQLRDFLRFDDTDHDSKLHVNEFFSSFSHFYDITMISLDKALETKYTRAVEGDGVVLRCDITGSPPPYIHWKRYGTDLTQMAIPGMKSYIDNSLSLTNVHMIYAGHYSCQSPRNPEVVQTHILSVETQPYVVITPKASWKRPGEDLLLICRLILPITDSSSRADPTTGPSVAVVNWTWLFNGIPLRELPKSDNNNKYIFENSTAGISRLRIREIYFQDMGSFSCQAENELGVGSDTASLVVIDPGSKAEMQALHNTRVPQLLVFHRNGLASYGAKNCDWLWEIFGDDTFQYSKDNDMAQVVCDQFHSFCDWGEAVQVSPNYVYASQPTLNRVLLIDVGAVQSVGNALGSIETCANPTRLEYVPYTDQLWVRCETKSGGQGRTGFSVVENASRGDHHEKAIQFPLQQRNDRGAEGLERITDIYLPSHQDGKRTKKDCQFAYVSFLPDEQSLRRIDLKTFTYPTNSYLNLTKFSCVPHQIHFSVSCTFSIINCLDPFTKSPNGQVIVDTLSNAVRFKTAEISGSSIASSDNRILLTEKHKGNSTHVFVQRVGAYEIHLVSHFLLSNNLTTVRVVHSLLTEAYASVAKLSSGKEVILSLQTGDIQEVDDLQIPVPHRSHIMSDVYPVDNTFPLKTGASVIVMDAETLLPRCKFYEEIPELYSFLKVQS